MQLPKAKTILSLFVFILTAVLIYTSCRKIDGISSKEDSQLAERFLQVPQDVPYAIKRIAQTIKKQNDQYHFLNKFISKHGFAAWDKAPMLVKSSATPRGTEGTIDSVVIIPLIKANGLEVQSFLGCIVEKDSVKIRVFDGGAYAGYGYNKPLDSLGADFVAASIMMLDREVFGYKAFTIEDKKLFNYSGLSQESRYLIFDDSTSARPQSGIVITTTRCITGKVQDDPPPPTENGGGGQVRPNSMAEPIQICWSYDQIIQFVDPHHIIISTGTGGGGNEGWWNNDPCAGIRVAGGSCGGGGSLGWEPIYSYFPLPPYIINNLTKPCLKAALNKLSGGAHNSFFKQIFNVFDTASNLHIELSEASMASSYGLCSYADSSGIGPIAFITLDTTSLLGCSQEWISYVLIHEVAHAGMFANIVSWDTTNTQHENMITIFLTKMAAALTNAYPNLSLLDAYSICYAGFNNGIDGTVPNLAFMYIMEKQVKKSLNNYTITTQQLIDKGNEYTETGTKGTKLPCN